MNRHKLIVLCTFVISVRSLVINSSDSFKAGVDSANSSAFGEVSFLITDENKAADVFNGVYSECFLYLSFSCIQKKTLLYIQKLNDLSEITVLGDVLKFVKTNTSEAISDEVISESNELSSRIDKAIDRFFDSHILRVKALGKDIMLPKSVDDFAGRKKGGGGGGGGHGGGGHGGHGGDDGGKKKMMMMAMMCMKMKFMMMVPAMMGMMGMMSFKGMMFSMMSFMMSKMMLLMKILEKKGLGGGGGDVGSGWAAGGGGGGGAWMPAGGQDYGGGGGGGGYDSNGQWQSRSIPITYDHAFINTRPEISYVKPTIRYNNIINPKKPFSLLSDFSNEIIKIKNNDKSKTDEENNTEEQIGYSSELENHNSPRSRKKRGLMDLIQNAYIYWINRILGFRRYNKMNPLHQQQKYKIVNGVKYVYYPMKYVNKVKPPKNQATEPEIITAKPDSGFRPISVDDFNKGEIVESAAESRMNKRKFNKFKDAFNTVVDENPWE